MSSETFFSLNSFAPANQSLPANTAEQSDAILLYNGINAKVADAEMKKYLDSSTCRRQFLLKHFGINNVECPPGHSCCDICANSCQCLGSYCDMDLYLPVGYSEKEAQERTISDEQLFTLKKELNALKKSVVRESIAALKLACHTKPHIGSEVNSQLTSLPMCGFNSSVGRASHRYRGGHGFESR
ncbi:hypothetical protein ACROYT_G014444 [Oculina patagonica]